MKCALPPFTHCSPAPPLERDELGACVSPISDEPPPKRHSPLGWVSTCEEQPFRRGRRKGDACEGEGAAEERERLFVALEVAVERLQEMRAEGEVLRDLLRWALGNGPDGEGGAGAAAGRARAAARALLEGDLEQARGELRLALAELGEPVRPIVVEPHRYREELERVERRVAEVLAAGEARRTG